MTRVECNNITIVINDCDCLGTRLAMPASHALRLIRMLVRLARVVAVCCCSVLLQCVVAGCCCSVYVLQELIKPVHGFVNHICTLRWLR